MASKLWSTLPNELLHLIFARLPLAQIIRLQCLSKTWKWNLTSTDSEFKRACAEASPRMFAMFSVSKDYLPGLVQLYDIKENRWHWYLHEFFLDDNMFCAGGGGLVCVVSFDKRLQVRVAPLITVFNPLYPEQRRVLPHEDMQELDLKMVQLVMDRDKRCYKVLVVGCERNGGAVAKTFSSETGAWSGEIPGGLICGHWSTIDEFGFKERVGPCAYDCVGRQLLELDDGSHPFFLQFRNQRLGMKYVPPASYALVEDHLFVLHGDATGSRGNDYRRCRRYCVSEYRGQKCNPHWVKVRTHRFEEFERPPNYVSYSTSLYACKGFLLVRAENHENKVYKHVLTWLYDMATEKWQAIPPFADRVSDVLLNAMFQLQWDAIP